MDSPTTPDDLRDAPAGATLMRLPGGDRVPASPELVQQHLDRGEFFWLDVPDPETVQVNRLEQQLGVHPLAAEDAAHFGQRPKVDDYDDFDFVVAFGSEPGDLAPREVHCLISERWLITVHRGHLAAIEGVHRRFSRPGRKLGDCPAMALHAVLDELTDSLFPALDAVDTQIEDLEARLTDGDDRLQSHIFEIKRSLVGLSRIAGPQRDMLARLAGGLVELPGSTPEVERYMRDVHDHAVRVEELTDTYRELLSGATEVHLSAVNNRLSKVMQQLTVIATIFMPLTFITGFFGQNFGWMVDHIGGPERFVALGLGLPVAAMAALMAWFRRRGWT
ncbi:MAG: magnesium transporter CorA family protein [Thermoleophilia bacterium]